jgi:D-alanyl-D-alanine carboxypeptidase
MRGGLGRIQTWVVATGLVLLAAFPRPAAAQLGSDRYSAIVVDAATGTVLYTAGADQPRYPASLTKLMTLYMLFEAIRDRRVALDDLVPVSYGAASQEPSKLGLVPGTRITVEQGLLGLVTKSANDAAAALGELLAAGDEDRFAQMMTLRARALGMIHTTFRNASGLPDPYQVTTAEDLAILARHLVQDFPQEYGYFSVPSFEFHGRMIPNHDRMLQTYPGADGLKTGYTTASGYNLVTSALRGGVRLIGVVLGAGSSFERDQDMTAMLNTGFERMGVAPLLAAVPEAPRFAGLIAAAHAAPFRARGRYVGREFGGREFGGREFGEREFGRRGFGRGLERYAGGEAWERSLSERGVIRLQQVALAPSRSESRAERRRGRPVLQPAVVTIGLRTTHAPGGHATRHRARW